MDGLRSGTRPFKELTWQVQLCVLFFHHLTGWDLIYFDPKQNIWFNVRERTVNRIWHGSCLQFLKIYFYSFLIKLASKVSKYNYIKFIFYFIFENKCDPPRGKQRNIDIFCYDVVVRINEERKIKKKNIQGKSVIGHLMEISIFFLDRSLGKVVKNIFIAQPLLQTP